MRSLALFCALLGVPFFVACGGADANDEGSTDDSDLTKAKTSTPAPDTNVRYRYTLQGVPLPKEFCSLTFWINEWELSDNKPYKDSAVAYDGIPPGIRTHFDMPYSKRTFTGTIVLRCERGTAVADLEYSGAADPFPGSKQLLTAKITKLETDVEGVLSPTTPITIELTTIRIDEPVR